MDCNSDLPVVARQRCSKCYSRFHRSDSFFRLKKRDAPANNKKSLLDILLDSMFGSSVKWSNKKKKEEQEEQESESEYLSSVYDDELEQDINNWIKNKKLPRFH